MVQLALAFFAAALVSIQASPLFEKRIAQITREATKPWEDACDAATNTNQMCNPLAVTASQTLLANAGPCDQQNAADALIDFAKQQSNSAEMITLAQIFCQQPRNSPNLFSNPYCQVAPKNAELAGLYQCQYEGVNLTSFVGGLTVGKPGTMPFNHTSPLNPLGSCLAHPSGPIAGGTQLNAITTTPFASGGSRIVTGSGSASDSGSGSGSDSCPDTQVPIPAPSTTSTGNHTNGRLVPLSTKPTSTASMAAPAATSPSAGFLLSNGQSAQKMNTRFATLTPDSSCNVGDDACINGAFAQCVNGLYVLQHCAPTLTCYALPLILKAGTSIACTSTADAQLRIANTGAAGGITG